VHQVGFYYTDGLSTSGNNTKWEVQERSAKYHGIRVFETNTQGGN